MNQIINNLYEHLKNSPKKLKIVCDWDEVIQACEPYALWKAMIEWAEKETKTKVEKVQPYDEYSRFDFWIGGDCKVEYSSYGSKLKKEGILVEIREKQQEIKNSPNFYQEAPFLTIAEDLLKLIREDKVEKLIFLVYCKVLGVEEDKVIRDERIELIFKETFGKFPNCSLRKINYIEDDGGGVEVQYKKSDWVKKFASDFDIVIDDNPLICKSLVETLPGVLNPKFESSCRMCRENVTIRNIGGYEMYDDGVDIHSTVCRKKHCQEVCDNFRTVEKVRKMDYSQEEKYWEVEKEELFSELTPNNSMIVYSPYYPAIENQHHESVLLVKNEVSDLKREDFGK